MVCDDVIYWAKHKLNTKTEIYYTLVRRLVYKYSRTQVSRLRLSHQIIAHHRSTAHANRELINQRNRDKANKKLKPEELQHNSV